MNDSREFPTEAVLSCVGGKLLGDIGGIYDVLGFLTGASLFTHQLPRAMRECEPAIRAQLPQLADYDDAGVTPENVLAWRDAQLAKYGPTLTLVPLDVAADYSSPIGDLCEMMQGREDQIIVCDVPAPTTPAEP